MQERILRNDVAQLGPSKMKVDAANKIPGPLLLTWFNFNPSMDK